MSGSVKVPLDQWLGGMSDACSDQLHRDFNEEERAYLQQTRDDKMVYAGYLMGFSDAANEVKKQLERAHLANRKITVPDRAPTTDDTTDPGTDGSSPLTVGTLRAFLASRPHLSDDLPVIVGGVDFDEPGRKRMGLADVLWNDTEGAAGGRLCITAEGIGLAD